MYHELRIMFNPILGKNNPKTTTTKVFLSFISHTFLAKQLSSGQSLLKENLQSFTWDPPTFNPRGIVDTMELELEWKLSLINN